MFRKALIILGGVLNIAWGVAHMVPTGSVVSGFGAISGDNKNIITMEWINEGLTLIFIGVLVLLVTVVAGENNKTRKIVYLASAAMLFSMAVLSLFTGFNIDFLPYKLCPFIFSLSGILILQGAFRWQ
jgi:hypothetical protein